MAQVKKASQAKSKVARNRERVNGKFVSKNQKPIVEVNSANNPEEEVPYSEADFIPQEIRDLYGSDSKLFFEWALANAPTRYEAAKYAKELKNLQYPSLQAIQSKQELQITQKVLRWEWGNDAIESTETKQIEEDK